MRNQDAHARARHTRSPHFPFPQSREESIPCRSPPLAPIDPQHLLPLPLQPPALIRESVAGTKETEQTLAKQKRPRDTVTHSKDTPGILAAPSHTAATQGERGGEGFQSHKDDTEHKKNEERPAKPRLLSADRAAWWGWGHRTGDNAGNLTAVFCLFSPLPKA